MIDNTIVTVFGRKGSGKSTLVRQIADEFPRVTVIDTLGEYGVRTHTARNLVLPSTIMPGWTVTQTKVQGGAAIVRLAKLPEFRLSLRAADTVDLLELLEVVYEVPDQLVIVEEASFYVSPSQLPPQISTLVRVGRHRRISQVYVARRPSELHRDLTAGSDLVVSFQQHEPRDVEYLVKLAGPEAASVKSLKRFKVWAYGDLSKAPLALLHRLPEKRLAE